jgi:hypothetical protein
MTAILEQRHSRAARWSRGLSNFSLVLFAVACLAHHFGVLETGPFLLVLGIAGFLASCGLALSVLGFSRLWSFGDRGGIDSAFGAFVGLLVLSPFALAAYGAATHPQISDISTDLSDPPVLSYAARTRAGAMNEVAPIGDAAAVAQRLYYPHVVGRRYAMPITQVGDIVSAIIKRRGWRSVGARRPIGGPRIPPGEITLEAVAHTALFALPSDVAVRLTDEGETTFVDMRSASRFGSNDLGDNARRIIAFLNDLDLEVGLRIGLPIPDEPAQ